MRRTILKFVFKKPSQNCENDY